MKLNINTSTYSVGKITVTLFLLVFLFTPPTFGQYFGRNKVQYEDFDFSILKSEHFNLYHYNEEDSVANDAIHLLERWYGRYSRLFQMNLSGQQPVIMYANHADFQQTNVIRGRVSQGTGGVTEGLRNRIVLPMTGVYEENDHVLGHELVHAFQYDLMRRRAKGLRSSRQVPIWMVEGLAEYLTIGNHSPLTAMWMRDAVLHDEVPSIHQIMQDPRYFPYRYGHALWAYITGRWNDEIIIPLFTAVAQQGWEDGAKRMLNISSDSLSTDWQRAIRETYSPQLQGRTDPSDVGTPVLKEPGETNLAPSLSPDGQHLAFISRRDLFTLDLYLADMQTGEIVKRLVRSNTDAHFDAMRFMHSAGTWSPDSKTLAFVVIKDGDNKIALLDAATTEVKRVIGSPKVDAIRQLAWSPDGNSIAFSGTYGGIGNLYMLNVASGKVTQLTDDRYAEIQPDWSPDGSTIAFATDRGLETDFQDYRFQSLNIGLYNTSSREIRIVSMEPGVKHINPQFSPDGRSLFMIAAPDGFSDVYRYDLNSGQFSRITRVATGISGLTNNSPALTVADKSDKMVFSVYEDFKYHLYSLNTSQATGEPYTVEQGEYAAHTALPPVEYSNRGAVHDYLHRYTRGIQADSSLSRQDYQPQLQLFYVGQSGMGLAIDRFGVGLGGGVNFLFGDMLGNQMLSVTAQVNGGFKDIGGQALYRNRDSRFNWGAGIGHIPYRTGRSYSRIDTISSDGQSGLGRVFTRYIQRTFIDRVSLMTEYPFTTNRRLEFSAGYTRISYDAEIHVTETSLSGAVVDNYQQSVDTPPSINLFQTSAAYVGDYSFSGFTSPIRGKRFRFEVEPTMGSLRYVSALADYRQYSFLNPVTLAFRVLHYGRYFGDSESSRLTPLQVGYRTWVRGYSPSTFTASECTDPNGGCAQLERLVGSKIGVFNAEVRLPLFGTDQFGLLNFRYLPTELVGFFDGGVAWTRKEAPTLKWATHSSKRIPVFSTGIAARVNILEYLVAQVYYAYPFQRPEQGAQFGFVIAPGW